MKKTLLIGAALTALLGASTAQASFESGFTDWTVTGDAYTVTENSPGVRTRSNYQTYYGWEGADVWFNNAPLEGNTYAVFGSQGNESTGSLLRTYSATNAEFAFSTGGNITWNLAQSAQSYGAILDMQGGELARIYSPTYNDNQWRTFSFDLAGLGLSLNDEFQFSYVDNYSWSVVDGVGQTGTALQAASVSTPIGLAALALLPLMAFRRKRNM
jgi:hypothetical protein